MDALEIIKTIGGWIKAFHKYQNKPRLVLYFDGSESYHIRTVVNQNNATGFFCHLMVRNRGQKVAKACRGRVIDIRAKDLNGQFTKCPNFLNPFVLKWAHESDFSPKDIEPDIPRRLDLCYGLQTMPGRLIFFTPAKADGNQIIYPTGTYKVKVRIDAKNAQTTDGEFEIQVGSSWNDIRVTTIGGAENEEYSQEAQQKARRITPWLGLIAAFITLLAAVFSLWNPFAEKKISRTSYETKISAEAKTSGDSSPAITTSGPNSPVTNIYNFSGEVKNPKQSTETKLQVTLRAICDDIDSRPLAQQDETAKKYVDMKMKIKRNCFRVHGVEVNPGDPNIYDLELIFPDEPYSPNIKWMILCTVSKDIYPQLSIARKGNDVYVSGEVETIFKNPMTLYKFVELSNVTLEFE